MLSLDLSKGTTIYYDIESKIIGRKPSPSNLKEQGSDNSIYLGIVGNYSDDNDFTRMGNIASDQASSGSQFCPRISFFIKGVGTDILIGWSKRFRVKNKNTCSEKKDIKC